MYSVGVISVIGLVSLIWLLILTLMVWKDRKFIRQLFPKSGERDIRQKLQEVMGSIKEFQVGEEMLSQRLDKIEQQSLHHIQRVSVLRYNPYGDTGGDQSFSVALLDANLDGFILTSLHSRAGTRVYVKNVLKGETDLDLSKEEREVVKQALK